MQEQIKQRLTQLKAEFDEGQKMLADLEAKEANLKNTPAATNIKNKPAISAARPADDYRLKDDGLVSTREVFACIQSRIPSEQEANHGESDILQGKVLSG